VLMSYGDGAVMGVPAHDERDLAFANKYSLPIQQVVQVGEHLFDATTWQDWYADKQAGKMLNSGKYDGLAFKDCVNAVAADLAAKGLGEKKTTWRLRDWGISRQRYWGTPIPIIHCDACGAVPVPEKDLPVVLPTDLVPDGSGNPLNKSANFLNVACPTCGKPAKRETDTMDTFVDSSWYYSRYCDPTNKDAMVAGGAAYWMQGGMDQYIGGIEHAILHLLYARFWTKVMRDLGLLAVDEPFKKLLCQGMVLNHVYSRKTDKGAIDYFWPADVEHTFDADGKISGAKLKSDGSLVDYGGVTTMSKSKNNGVDPQDIIDRYGADTARLYMMFTAPPEATLEWNDAAVEGSYRFLRRVWNTSLKLEPHIKQGLQYPVSTMSLGKDLKTLRREVHTVLKQINFDYERMQYNTVVSGCMKILNLIDAAPFDDVVELEVGNEENLSVSSVVGAELFGLLIKVLYPACPHIAFQLWTDLGYSAKAGDLLDAAWPDVDESALLQDELELMLQINGKLRGSITVPAAADKAAIEAAALATEAFIKQAAGTMPKKVIVVPGRLVNIVL
jgi:leucyl-tRNA synthetase